MAATKERPIIFSGPMVRAILDGRKTVTRRVSKVLKAPHGERADDGWPMAADEYGDWHREPCPYGQPGDRLWVRETFGLTLSHDDEGRIIEARKVRDGDGRQRFILYRADGDVEWSDGDGYAGPSCWKPSIHMPRWASRLTLEVVSVRVERLHDITEEEARAEGAEAIGITFREGVPGVVLSLGGPYRDGFRILWSSINGAESWDANPWVWRVEFKPAPKGGG